MNNMVSIIVPIYNSEMFLEETIESIVNQTYKNIEIILVDDGSTDLSAKICKKFSKIDDRIVYVYKQNGGVVEARNLGIRNAKGTYILPVDSDDVIDKTYVEKAINIIKNKDVDIVYCEAEMFGNRNGKWLLPEYSLKQILKDNCIFVTAMYRKDAWEKIGGYKNYMAFSAEDYDFWLSMIELGARVYRIPEVLFKYRIRDGSRTSISKFRKEEIIKNHKNLYENNIDLLDRGDLKKYIRVELSNNLPFFQRIKISFVYILLRIHVVNKLSKEFFMY